MVTCNPDCHPGKIPTKKRTPSIAWHEVNLKFGTYYKLDSHTDEMNKNWLIIETITLEFQSKNDDAGGDYWCHTNPKI